MLLMAVAATVIIIKAIRVAVIMSPLSTVCIYLFLVFISSHTCTIIMIMIIIFPFLSLHKVITSAVVFYSLL